MRLCFAGLFLLLSILTSPGLRAELREGDTVEAVVAHVAELAIFDSEVRSRLMYAAQLDNSIDTRSRESYLKVLNSIIDEKLLVAKAIEDSVEVTDDEIDRAIDFQIDQYVRQYGSLRRVEEIFRKTVGEIRHEFRETMRQSLLGQKLAQNKFFDLQITQGEVEEFYAEFRDSLPVVPPQVDLHHIVKYVEKENEATQSVRDQVKVIRDSIAKFGDFARFAADYSEDPGSKDNGGDLGVVKRGTFIAEFEEAAFELSAGEISEPVKTPFGFHIIELISKQEDQIHVRHILFSVGQSADDVELARAALDSLRQRAINGENFEDLAREYSDEVETRGFGGFMERRWRIADLSPDLQAIILQMNDGDVTEPLTYPKDPLRAAFHIVYRKKYFPEHSMNLEDDFDVVKEIALRRKRQTKMKEWVLELRKSIHVKIRVADN